ncbi:MAG: hypothetical protein JNK90_10000 [Planctomycetaceae bacterium]|nr:hypothetical protein [Planctomycetaceae bacterium]
MIETFTLNERFALGGEYTWRLKDGEIRFRGSRQFASLVNQRIPAPEQQVDAFRDALDLLDVWSWRNDYGPEDVGYAVLDGSAWTFEAAYAGRQCKCGGANGYPSFADASKTTTDPGRFACLVAAMYACFSIDAYIHIAAHQRQREVENRG